MTPAFISSGFGRFSFVVILSEIVNFHGEIVVGAGSDGDIIHEFCADILPCGSMVIGEVV